MSVNIGIIGGGTFGLMHLRTFRQLQDEGRVDKIALAEINEDLLNQRCEEFGVKGYARYADMLAQEDLDGVTVVTPDFLHHKYSMDCVAAGKHVLVEKPLDTTVRGCTEIAEAAEAAGILLEVDFHKRFDPFHIELKETIAAGKMGAPEYGYAWMEDCIVVPRDWFPHWAPKSSPAWFLGSHMVDLFRWCIGNKNGVRVWASGQKRKLVELGIDSYDAVQAMIEFEDNASLHLHTAWVLPDSFEATVNQGIRIVGSEGISEVDSQDRGARMSLAGAPKSTTFNPVFFLEQTGPDGRTRYSGYGVESIADFVKNIEFLQSGITLANLKGTYADARDGLEVTRIIEGVHRSLETGSMVEL